MWFGKPNKHKSISGESFIPKPGGLSARGGLPAFCLGRDSGRILARALVLFGADAVELFKRPAEVGAVLVPHRHGNVPDFLPAAQQQASPCCSTFSWRRKTRHAEAAPPEPAHCFKRRKGSQLCGQPGSAYSSPGKRSWKKPQGTRRPHRRGNFPYKTYPHSG